MKKELLDNMIEKIEVEVDNYYLDCFIEECFESELLEEDMTTFLLAKMHKDTHEVCEIRIIRIPTHISWESSKYE